MAQRPDTELNETARRCLNLFFVLNIARTPLSTSRIIEDPDIGYATGVRSSDKKSFARDRERLEQLGIHIRAVKPAGSEATEEAQWEIDRTATYTSLAALSTPTLEALLSESRSLEQNPLWTSTRALDEVQFKLRAELSRRYGAELPRQVDMPPREGRDAKLERLWSLSSRNIPAQITYTNALGATHLHTVDIYGFFSCQGATYLVGRAHKLDEVRTFRADRIERVKQGKGTYCVPDGLNLQDYLFLPFDFGNSEPIEVCFSFPPQVSAYELASLTHERGSLTKMDEASPWTWRIGVRDLEAAAAFALTHGSLGMRPIAPESLILAWNESIEKAVSAHGQLP